MSAAPRIQVVVNRRFSASADRVFDAFLDPAKAGRFMFATLTGQLVHVAIDPRVGGRFTFVDRRDGEDVEHVGEYLQIERPKRLVFTLLVEKYSQDADVVTIGIVARGSGCELTLTHAMSSEWADRRGLIESGWIGVLDGLAAAIDTQDDERQIRELVTTWMAASKAGDVETVLGLMAEDVVFLVAGQAPMIGRSAYAAAARAQVTPHAPKVDGVTERPNPASEERLKAGHSEWRAEYL